MTGYKQAIESSIIVTVGMLMHLYRVSIFELQYSKTPPLTPNPASALFVFSVLCTFSKLRSLWPKTRCKPQQFLVFLVQLALILYATDFLLRQIWLPRLKLLNFLCHYLGQYVIVANLNFLTYNAPKVSEWMRHDAFYTLRFLLAIAAFIFMLKATGAMEFIQNKLSNGHNKIVENPVPTLSDQISSRDNNIKYSRNNTHYVPFDVNDLPYVPQEDLLNFGYRVGARRSRKKAVRKTKRKPNILLNDATYESDC